MNDYLNNSVRKTEQITASAEVVNNSAVSLQDNRPGSVIQKKQIEDLSNKTVQSPIQKKANNTGLPNQLKAGVENLSGYSMDDVKVHYNSVQPAQLNAHAYAQGTDIHIASGQEKHLPHEAWHVVQQKQGRVKPTMQMKGKVNVNDNEGLENEADVMGAKAKRGFTSPTQLMSYFTSQPQKTIQTFAKSFDIKSQLQNSKNVIPVVQMGRGRPRAASRAANVRMGLDPRGRDRIRRRRLTQRFDPDTSRASRVNFTFNGLTKKGLDPGGQWISKTSIAYTGTHGGDFTASNAAVGIPGTPLNMVWHHYHNYKPSSNTGTMYLMYKYEHNRLKHHGGVWMYKNYWGHGY